MISTSLDAPVPYHAVSYTWGSSETVNSVNIDGYPAFISGNLHYALRQIYAVLQPGTWLWIDSLCINQLDIVEKSRQVSQMGRVFATAELVYICMGPATDDSDQLIEFLTPLGHEAAQAGLFAIGFSPVDTRDPAQTKTAAFVRKLVRTEAIYSAWFRTALQALVDWPNWHRCWIIQEIALARRGLLLCGGKSISLDAFHAVLFALEKVSKWREKSDVPGNNKDQQLPRFYQSSILGLESRHVRGQAEYTTLRWFLVSRTHAGNELEPGPFYAATDPRDVIFAFLGIVSDRALLCLEPDYTKPVGRVYAEATAAMMRLHPHHQKLEMCSFPKDLLDLPSWVPDWSRIGRLGIRQPLSWINEFVASGSTTLKAADVVFSENLALRRRGFQFDVVESVFISGAVVERPDQDDLEMALSRALASSKTRAALLAAILDFARSLPPFGRDKLETRVWRTLVVDLYRDPDNDDWYETMSRMMVHGEALELSDTFSGKELAFIWQQASASKEEQPQDVVDRFLASIWQQAVRIAKGRTLFSTTSGRLGLGPYCVQAGDVATILEGTGVPILLRPAGEMHNYVGDAYIEGVMYGELMELEQSQQDFDIL